MRIVYFGNNRLGCEVLKWLKNEPNVELVGLVTHPQSRQKNGPELERIAQLPAERVFDGSRVKDSDFAKNIKALEPELGISVLFGYILPPEILNLFPKEVINLHPSLLPFNRGGYPNVWSIVEGTPAGATLHYLDEGIDTGDILAQKSVDVDPTDTGESLYAKLETASLNLFIESWPRYMCGELVRKPQQSTEGTVHRTRDVEMIDKISLTKQYKAEDLINLIRARTFPPHRGAYFEVEGRKVFVRVELEYSE